MQSNSATLQSMFIASHWLYITDAIEYMSVSGMDSLHYYQPA